MSKSVEKKACNQVFDSVGRTLLEMQANRSARLEAYQTVKKLLHKASLDQHFERTVLRSWAIKCSKG
jgi:hypothetical protein